MRFRRAIHDARDLIRSARDASKDNLIDTPEAIDLVQDSFDLVRDLVGKVKLSENAKTLLRAGAKELLQLLGDEPEAKT